MLPGFRFLFAATVLTVSLVVFGLGAAALLRASHERFASLPTRPAPGPAFSRTPDAAPPTLALLRVETSVETSAPEPIAPLADTLLPTDRIAALSNESGIEEVVTPPALETTPEPVGTVAEPEVADTPPVPAPVETVAAALVEPFRSELPAESDLQQVASLPDPEITGSAPTPVIAEPPLVNANPIKRPPMPIERPAAADVVAALPDPALAVDAAKPVVRLRKPVVKRVAVQKPRGIARTQPRRPAAPRANPASPFGAPGLGASPFGQTF